MTDDNGMTKDGLNGVKQDDSTAEMSPDLAKDLSMVEPAAGANITPPPEGMQQPEQPSPEELLKAQEASRAGQINMMVESASKAAVLCHTPSEILDMITDPDNLPSPFDQWPREEMNHVPSMLAPLLALGKEVEQYNMELVVAVTIESFIPFLRHAQTKQFTFAVPDPAQHRFMKDLSTAMLALVADDSAQ